MVAQWVAAMTATWPASAKRIVGSGLPDRVRLQGHRGQAVGRLAAPGGEGHPDGTGAAGRLAGQWQDSRRGAWSGRGLIFQDAVGAWLAANVAAGRIRADGRNYFGLELLGSLAAPGPGPFGSFDTEIDLSVVYPPRLYVPARTLRHLPVIGFLLQRCFGEL